MQLVKAMFFAGSKQNCFFTIVFKFKFALSHQHTNGSKVIEVVRNRFPPRALNRGSGFGDHILDNVGSFQMCLQVTFGLRLAPSPPLIEITRVIVFSSRFVSLIVFCSLAQISILATNGQVLREDWLFLVTWRTSANVGRLIFITNSPQYECEAYWSPQ